jgi:hypothetical protein
MSRLLFPNSWQLERWLTLPLGLNFRSHRHGKFTPKAFRSLLGAVNYKVICYNFEDRKLHLRVF